MPIISRDVEVRKRFWKIVNKYAFRRLLISAIVLISLVGGYLWVRNPKLLEEIHMIDIIRIVPIILGICFLFGFSIAYNKFFRYQRQWSAIFLGSFLLSLIYGIAVAFMIFVNGGSDGKVFVHRALELLASFFVVYIGSLMQLAFLILIFGMLSRPPLIVDPRDFFPDE